MATRRRKRDYAAEYKRRVARARSKGFTMDIARGHPREGTVGLKLARKIGVPVGTEIADITVRTVNAEPASPRKIRRGLRNKGISEQDIRRIDVTDQETFVRTMLGYGLSWRQAFDLYFGYA